MEVGSGQALGELELYPEGAQEPMRVVFGGMAVADIYSWPHGKGWK